MLSTFRFRGVLSVKRRTGYMQSSSNWEEALVYLLHCVTPDRENFVSSNQPQINADENAEKVATETTSAATSPKAVKKPNEDMMFPVCVLSGHMAQSALQRAYSEDLVRYDRNRIQPAHQIASRKNREKVVLQYGEEIVHRSSRTLDVFLRMLEQQQKQKQEENDNDNALSPSSMQFTKNLLFQSFYIANIVLPNAHSLYMRILFSETPVLQQTKAGQQHQNPTSTQIVPQWFAALQHFENEFIVPHSPALPPCSSSSLLLSLAHRIREYSRFESGCHALSSITKGLAFKRGIQSAIKQAANIIIRSSSSASSSLIIKSENATSNNIIPPIQIPIVDLRAFAKDLVRSFERTIKFQMAQQGMNEELLLSFLPNMKQINQRSAVFAQTAINANILHVAKMYDDAVISASSSGHQPPASSSLISLVFNVIMMMEKNQKNQNNNDDDDNHNNHNNNNNDNQLGQVTAFVMWNVFVLPKIISSQQQQSPAENNNNIKSILHTEEVQVDEGKMLSMNESFQSRVSMIADFFFSPPTSQSKQQNNNNNTNNNKGKSNQPVSAFYNIDLSLCSEQLWATESARSLMKLKKKTENNNQNYFLELEKEIIHFFRRSTPTTLSLQLIRKYFGCDIPVAKLLQLPSSSISSSPTTAEKSEPFVDDISVAIDRSYSEHTSRFLLRPLNAQKLVQENFFVSAFSLFRESYRKYTFNEPEAPFYRKKMRNDLSLLMEGIHQHLLDVGIYREMIAKKKFPNRSADIDVAAGKEEEEVEIDVDDDGLGNTTRKLLETNNDDLQRNRGDDDDDNQDKSSPTEINPEMDPLEDSHFDSPKHSAEIFFEKDYLRSRIPLKLGESIEIPITICDANQYYLIKRMDPENTNTAHTEVAKKEVNNSNRDDDDGTEHVDGGEDDEGDDTAKNSNNNNVNEKHGTKIVPWKVHRANLSIHLRNLCPYNPIWTSLFDDTLQNRENYKKYIVTLTVRKDSFLPPAPVPSNKNNRDYFKNLEKWNHDAAKTLMFVEVKIDQFIEDFIFGGKPRIVNKKKNSLLARNRKYFASPSLGGACYNVKFLPPSSSSSSSSSSSLPIIYRDPHCAVIVKQEGVSTIPALDEIAKNQDNNESRDKKNENMVSLCLDSQLWQTGPMAENLSISTTTTASNCSSTSTLPARFGVTNRLDKGTSGYVVFAFTDEAMSRLRGGQKVIADTGVRYADTLAKMSNVLSSATKQTAPSSSSSTENDSQENSDESDQQQMDAENDIDVSVEVELLQVPSLMSSTSIAETGKNNKNSSTSTGQNQISSQEELALKKQLAKYGVPLMASKSGRLWKHYYALVVRTKRVQGLDYTNSNDDDDALDDSGAEDENANQKIPPAGVLTAPVRGQSAITRYKFLRHYNCGISLVRCSICTGRRHQIREHMSSIGFPIVNDVLVGGPVAATSLFIDGDAQQQQQQKHQHRLALHLYESSFIRPEDGERVCVTMPLPSNFASVLNELEEKDDKIVKGYSSKK